MGHNESTRARDSSSHAGHDHDHGHGGGSTSSRKLAAVSVVNVVGFLVELAGGLAFGSVALISDAVHMLFDALAYVMAFAAARVAEGYGNGDRWSYGLHRLEPFAAFLNGLLLLPMVGFILWESYQRFLEPVAIGTGPTIAIAVGGLLVNVGSVSILHDDAMSLNERGAFYHLLGDAGGSIAVIVSVLVIEVTGIRVVDPITAGLIAAVVAWSAVRVLRGSGAIFFLETPLDIGEIRAHLEAIDGVDRVDDVHAWQICSQITVATVHVETGVETMAEAEAVVGRAHDELAGHGVDHATVELSPRYADRDVHLNTHCH
ncbi:cation diffusion facilitator family transporter [Natrinema pellirubrum DSM 15624]|uniref:Cation diffusion facilitator family transporter n=1 Tax=Natrinema pellirubrum (strain DSM 15624 / CIP 106293 / JCM 10476 / NCIMB 786 / 157) TaxID=797303 RepID=L0JNG6_NATP1|nr:cation diffusion facilitator family transporter [Natrinema pellirubrum]AGB33085.1 cation diffusion facilitator family transporter [Natrinema pellirubrum DSM 15624]ELY71751.1 cation diffusion facilitator family transporter [Natrinema pellirubrum DSM 15624]